jgi:hypothetical protein
MIQSSRTRSRKASAILGSISSSLPQTTRPYADADIVFILVGPDATPFSVHNTVLAQSAVLAAKFDTWNMAKQNVSIQELDESTAHTLVHYLYTGKYQNLCNSAQINSPTISSYKAGTCVYCAAVRYELSDLAELAKNKITTLDEGLGIAQILDIARDYAFPLLPEDETWYLSYLEEVIRSAMLEDPEPFRRPNFIRQVEGNSRLLQVVWKTVMNNYVGTIITPKVQNDERPEKTEAAYKEVMSADTQKPHKSRETSPVKVLDLISTNGFVVANSLATEPSEPEPCAADGPFEDISNSDDIERTINTPQAPDPFTDELGFEKSKMYQKMGHKDKGLELQSVQESDSEQSVHKRSNSVLQVEEVAAIPLEVSMSDDAVSMVIRGSSEMASASKKSKKSKKKKSSIVF